MAYTFEQIMNYHPGNQSVYDEIKNNISTLIPFIGAGLSQFAYPSWYKALIELSDKITNTKSKKQIKALINEGNYFDAAQLLETLRTPINLKQDLVEIFAEDKLKKKKDILSQQAVYLLPYLFPGLVLTTNFEETLETVYREQNHPFNNVSHPGHTELLNQLLMQPDGHQVSSLYKLHGTINKDMIEYGNFVFTTKQYDYHYAANSKLTNDLKKCLTKKMIFFLGCSLMQDRTMELLQSVLEPGIQHYTIIDCKKTERDNKIIDLGNKQIRAILYQKGRHEAVRVILEHLLEEIAPDKYKRLQYHIGALPLKDNKNRFVYNNGIIDLYGREAELKKLNEFLEDTNVSFCWWAITGPAGSGKSRLAYELQQKLNADWNVYYLKDTDYKNLFKLREVLSSKTLLIADYVQVHARELGIWMRELCDHERNLPLRVLLVERQACVAQSETAWTKTLYSDVQQVQRLKNACYLKDFLVLKPLKEEDLINIISAYARALQQQNLSNIKKELSLSQKQMLLNTLQDIDPFLQRPLYAMFLTDAYLDGNSLKEWDKEYILTYIVEREIERLRFSVKQVMGSSTVDENLAEACMFLQCIATTLQDVDLDTIVSISPNTWRIIKNKSENFATPGSLLTQLGLLNDNIMLALRPDLLGEYYVLKWLFEHEERRVEFLSSVYQKPLRTMVFFTRLFNDYSTFLNELPIRWELLLPADLLNKYIVDVHPYFLINAAAYCNDINLVEQFIDILRQFSERYPDNLEMDILYAKGLFNLSCVQREENVQDTVKRLQKISEKYPENEEIAAIYAEGLFNLSCDQKGANAQDSIERLQQLSEKYPDNKENAIVYAKGLYNLSCMQKGANVQDTVERLLQLSKKYSENDEIVIVYAKGLFNLCCEQKEQEAQYTIERLLYLSEKYPKNEEIAIVYAKGLFNLSNKQKEGNAQDTIKRLQQLSEKNLEKVEMAVLYAKSLVNLSCEEKEANAQVTIKKLQKLREKYPENEEIALDYAKGLFNLSNKQKEGKAQDTIGRLQELSEKNPDNIEIAFEYVKGLFNLSNKQKEGKAQDTIERLQQLSEKYPEKIEMAVRYAKGLFNLSCKQKEGTAQNTIKRLQQFSERYPENIEIAIAYAKGLFNLSCKQKEAYAQDTIERLQKLSVKYPEKVEMAVLYAQSLVNLSYEQKEGNAQDTIKRLQQISEKNLENVVIALEYAKGLVNLSNKQKEGRAQGTIDRLQQLNDRYPETIDIAIAYAKGLDNLSNKQKEGKAQHTIERLQQLSERYLETIDIAIAYAKGLVYLSNKQKVGKAQDTIERLQQFSESYPENIDIAIAYAKGLVNLSNKKKEANEKEKIAQ